MKNRIFNRVKFLPFFMILVFGTASAPVMAENLQNGELHSEENQNNETQNKTEQNQEAQNEEGIISAPSAFTAQAVSQEEIHLSWNPQEGADGYCISRADAGSDENGEEYEFLTLAEGNENCSYSDIAEPGIYSYRICSYVLEANGEKEYSVDSDAVMVMTAPPAAEITDIRMAAYNKISVFWKRVEGCSGYAVYRSKSETGHFSLVRTIENDSTCTWSNLVNTSEGYYYKVCAYIEISGRKVYGELSEPVKGSVLSGPPENFTASISRTSGNKTIRFSWNRVDDADGYILCRSDSLDGNFSAIRVFTDTATTDYTISSDQKEVAYYLIKSYRLDNGRMVSSKSSDILINYK